MTTFAQMMEDVRPPPLKIPQYQPYTFNQVCDFFMGDSMGFVLRHLEQGMMSESIRSAMVKRIHSNKILRRMRYEIPECQVPAVREYVEALFLHIFLQDVRSQTFWEEILATLQELAEHRSSEWMMFCACILILDPQKIASRDTKGENHHLVQWICDANLTMFKE